MNQMASAVESARQGSMAAQQYDPAANIMKKTTSPYQAGIGSFYAGGIAAKGAARKFGNTFDQVQATARNWQERMPGMVASGVADKQRADQMAAGQEQDRKNALFASAQEGYRNSLDEAARTGGMQDPHRMDNLTWLLRTGRISAEEMYAAQKDERLYNELLKRGDYGSSGNAPRR